MLTIAADPKHLGAKIGITSVLHTWGSAMTHHPHVHMIVTGGGISKDGSQWVASRPDYLVPVEVLSALFRGRMLGMLIDAHAAGRLQFFGDYQHLADAPAFRRYLGPLWTTDWFVYAKRPFAGPEQVLAYLSRYTHRVAISNSRLISADASGVTFTYKDYRIEGPERYKTMTLEPGEFIRRFLMHVLPKGFHRIRHYGLLANGGTTRAEKLARARQLIATAPQIAASTKSPHNHGTCEDTTLSEELDHPCPHCGSRMVIIETFEPGRRPRHRPSAPISTISINTS
jgi:Putative transposase